VHPSIAGDVNLLKNLRWISTSQRKIISKWCKVKNEIEFQDSSGKAVAEVEHKIEAPKTIPSSGSNINA
jgi:hypothetical protein